MNSPMALSLARIATSCGWHPGLLTVRGFSANAAVVEEMIHYVTRQNQRGHDQAIDVLRSGLSMTGTSGGESAQLLCTMAHFEIQRSNWTAVSNLAADAVDAMTGVSGGHEGVLLRGQSLLVQGLLAQGSDEQALKTAQDAVATEGRMQTPTLGLLLRTAHAVGELETASDASARLSLLLPEASSSSRTVIDATQVDMASSCSAMGFWALHTGDASLATSYFQQARESAQKAAADAKAAKAPLVNEFQHAESESEALVGLAQVSCLSKDWDKAEALLGEAVTAAESAGEKSHPRLAIVLTLLGYVYSRSARVTFAEGLYREASKMLRIDPVQTSSSGSQKGGCISVHSSIQALLGWRYFQLLSALPKRGGEAATWLALSQDTWRSSGSMCSTSLDSLLGGADHLKGTDETAPARDGFGLLATLSPGRAVLG